MPVSKPLQVGIVGCGTISAAYLKTFARLAMVEVAAVADIDLARAEAVATAHPGVRALSPEALVADLGVDLVLNLTIPAAHAEVALAAIASGKSVYGEKPLATSTAEARAVLSAAASANVRLGCAPDTVLGTGIQTARRAVDDGLIGAPISAIAILGNPGPERWHHNPDFYYLPGGGPLLDMGPYYITTLVTMLGPVAAVIGAASHTRDQRAITAGPRAGETFPVLTDTHVTGVLKHASGALSTLFMSFDTVATVSARIEVHGQQGSLVVPDPNTFAGDVRLKRLGEPDWQTLPVSAGYADSARGFGVADLAATSEGSEPRAGGRLAFHVLDVMESLLVSAREGRAVPIDSTCERPPLVPLQSIAQAGVM